MTLSRMMNSRMKPDKMTPHYDRLKLNLIMPNRITFGIMMLGTILFSRIKPSKITLFGM